MSKLPNISPSSARTSIQNTDNESSNNILDSAKEDRNIILPILNQDNNNINSSKNPLLLNSKLTELEAKYISLVQNYEYILNKITSNEKKITVLQNNLKNTDNNLNLSKSNKKVSSNNEQDKIDRNFTILNNKIKYLEEMLKSDQENRAQEKQKELDFTKNLFNKINSSLTNTIQMEVEQRFKADLLQKNSNMKEIDLLQNQINEIKLQYEQMQNLFMKKLEENNNECSERNQNLAKYVDVRLDDQNLKKDSRELKKFLEKLTEQIKNNMNNQIIENDSFNQKIKNSEKKLDNSIKEIYDFLNKIELRTVNKLKNMKQYFDINLLNSNKSIERNVSKILKQYEKNFVFFSEELLSTRHNSNLEFQNIHKKIKFNNQAFVADLENIIKHQVQLENIVINRFKEIELMKKDIFFYPRKTVKDLPLYGNQFIPLGIKTTLQERIRIASLFDGFCNGGSILHINIDAPFNSKEAAWDMLNYVADQGVTYFAFNIKIQACKHNHAFYGKQCPICGEPVETEYTRIVGFFTPVKTYSKERTAEFKLREWEDVNAN